MLSLESIQQVIDPLLPGLIGVRIVLFDRGYGQLTWFQLNLYLSAISVAIGFVGYAAAAIIRRGPPSKLASALAGVAFTAFARILAFALAFAFPDRDMTAHGFAGALLLGALSTFFDRRNNA